MKAKMANKVLLEGVLYEHDLTIKESGPNSKNPGTEFISGTIDIATDDAMLNIVQVHYTYVTATTAKGGANRTFNVLKGIIDGTYGTYMKNGADNAVKVKADTVIGLNDFPVERNGKEEMVSVKRNEGGFLSVIDVLNENEAQRNFFEVDIIINNVRRVEYNEEKEIPEHVIVKGAVFDFRKALLPIELTAENEGAMDYFENLGATEKSPVFTKVWGRQKSQTVVRKIVKESAFGEDSVREVKNVNKAFVITGAEPEPYLWDDESSITVAELNEAISNREIYLASVKQRNDEWKAAKANAASVAAPTQVKQGDFSF